MSAGVSLALVQLALDTHLGTSTASYVTHAFPEVSGYGANLALGARYRLEPHLSLGARAALAIMRIEQPAGALYNEAAWANPELSVRYEHSLLDANGWSLALAPQLALGLPLAEHDSEASQLEGRALTLANALEGFGESELFTPGVLPITPAGQLELRTQRWQLVAALKLPMLIRLSDASLPAESGKRALGVVPVLDLEARLQLLRWFAIAVEPRLAWRAVKPVEDQGAAFQPLIGGSLRFKIVDALQLAVSFRSPIAGPLGGSTFAGGLRLQSEF